MSLETYLGLTPDQTMSAWELWRKQKQEDSKHSALEQWRIARWQTWMSLYPPEKKSANQFDILQLDGDNELKDYLKKKKQEGAKKPQRNETRFRAIIDKWK